MGNDGSLTVEGPPRMVMPGSEQVLFGAGLVLCILGIVVLVVGGLRRWSRRRRGAPGQRAFGLVTGCVLLSIGLVSAVVNWPPPFWVPEFPALPRLLPEEAFFYQRGDSLPATGNSEAQVAALGDHPIVAAASSKVVDGVVLGKPFNLVDASTPRHRFSFLYSGSSDHVEYPITEPAYIQSMPLYNIDDHYIGVDLEDREMWEIFMIRNWFGNWTGGSGAHWDLDQLTYPKGKTNAAGLPMLPGLFTWAEVDAGRIDHVMTVSSPVSRKGEWIWPARSSDGTSTDPDAPPMGAWLRLRADADLSELGPQARVIATAMQSYGVIIDDTGGTFAVHGTPDARWDNADLATLRLLSTSELEVVDASGLMVSEDSMATDGSP